MTITERPSRPIARPALIIILCAFALLASGLTYGATGWVWLGFLNLIIVLVGGFAVLWLALVLIVLAAGWYVGRTRR